MNNTPHIVGQGTKTLAAARHQQQKRRDDALAKRRAPQVEIASEFEIHGRGNPSVKVLDLDEGDPRRVLFKATLDAFLTAQPEKDRTGKTTKGATIVATEIAAEKHAELLTDTSTQDGALAGIDLALKALRWAGGKLFNKPQSEESPNGDTDSAAPAKKAAPKKATAAALNA